MSIDTAIDWLWHHESYAAGAETFDQFCDLVGGPLAEHYRSYRWLPTHFDTLKAHPGSRMYHALQLPKAHTVADVFATADCLPTDGPKPTGYYFVSSLRGGRFGVCDNLGGSRYIRKFPDGSVVRGIAGAKFYGTYAQLTTAAQTAIDNYATISLYGPYSLEAIDREDGILITVQSSRILGSLWLALLPREASLVPLFPQATRDLIATNEALEREAWSCIVTGPDGREYLDESVVPTVEVRTR